MIGEAQSVYKNAFSCQQKVETSVITSEQLFHRRTRTAHRRSPDYVLPKKLTTFFRPQRLSRIIYLQI